MSGRISGRGKVKWVPLKIYLVLRPNGGLLRFKIGDDLHGLDGTYEYIFTVLCPVQVLKNIIREYKGIPKPESLTKDSLLNHITKYINRNFPRENLIVKFTELILGSHQKEARNELKKTLGEPETEANLKPRMKRTLEEIGYTPYDEVKLLPATRADEEAKIQNRKEIDWTPDSLSSQLGLTPADVLLD